MQAIFFILSSDLIYNTFLLLMSYTFPHFQLIRGINQKVLCIFQQSVLQQISNIHDKLGPMIRGPSTASMHQHAPVRQHPLQPVLAGPVCICHPPWCRWQRHTAAVCVNLWRPEGSPCSSSDLSWR